jgi:superfamily II DNA or RNA helicase
MSSKTKIKTKGKKTKKGKSVPKKKIKLKQKMVLGKFLSAGSKERVSSDLTSFFARAAKKKAKKKKQTKESLIKQYYGHKTKVSSYEAELQKQMQIRYSPDVLVPYLYEEWRKAQSNKEDYPVSGSTFYDNWEATKQVEPKEKVKPEEWRKGGDGRKKKIREIGKLRYDHSISAIPKMETKHDFLPLAEEIRDMQEVTPEVRIKKTDVGISSYLEQDSEGRDIEITHLINYQPSAIPIYKYPDTIHLAKSDDWGEITLTHSEHYNEAKLRHNSRITPKSRWNLMTNILRKHGFSYESWSQSGSRAWNVEKVASCVKELRANGFTVEVLPHVPIPEPLDMEKPIGDSRFDVLMGVDRTTFNVKVTGRSAEEFLMRLDTDTRAKMRAEDREAWLKQHPKVKLMTRNMSATERDEWIEQNAEDYLPKDKHWHFVNFENQTIPIGFVYHYALNYPEYNIKITDNRPLYINERTPIDPKFVQGFQLRDYQEEAIASAIKKKSGVVSAATGSGKTEIGAFIIAGQGLDAVWLAHTTDLVEQAEERMEARLGKNVGAYLGGRKEVIDTPKLDINVITVQSASALMKKGRPAHQKNIDKLENRLAHINREIEKETDSMKILQLENERDNETDGVHIRLIAARQTLKMYDFLQSANVQIFDESHHMKAGQFAEIAKGTPQARYRYGLSATPWGNTSTDQKRIESVLGKDVANIRASFLIERGFLAKPNILMVDIPAMVDSDDEVYQAGAKKTDPLTGQDRKTGYNAMDENAVVFNSEFNDKIVEYTLDSQDSGLTTLILCRRVDHGNFLVEKLQAEGQNVDHLNAKETSRGDQKVILERFREKETDILVATIGKAGEGVDLPHLDTVILAHGGRSLISSMQRVGRAMRVPQGSNKQECVIIDFDRKEKFLDKQSKARVKNYSSEPAFDVKYIDESNVDDELRRVARINTSKQIEKETFDDKLDTIRDFSSREVGLTRSERSELGQLERDIDRLERFGTLEKTRTGRKLVVGEEAKRVAKRHPNITPVYAQQIINIVNARGYIDEQEIAWDNVDHSLEPSEAVQAAGLI